MGSKPRKWWIAGLLSLVEPGLGQIYNGQGRKGIIIFFLPTLLLPFMMQCLDSRHVLVYLGLIVTCYFAYYIVAVGDAITTARRLGSDFKLKKYNKGVIYAAIVILSALLSHSVQVAVRENYAQAFKIPAGSMEPTLLIGDHILVDRRASARNPQRGDLVVFPFPQDPSKDFVKRVVAVGGDTVTVRNKEVYVDDSPAKEPYVVHREPYVVPVTDNPRDNYGPTRVPAGCCFVLGDNRDRSYDSRFWGFVKSSTIKGTVKNIYWSWDSSKKSVRWDRIGTKVR